MSKSYSIDAAILCDDIRIEINNKLFLIGVYTGHIVVPHYPSVVSVCGLVSISGLPIGSHDFELALEGPGSKGEISGTIEVSEPDETSNIITPKLAINIEEKGEILIRIKIGDTKRRVVLRKCARVGDISQFDRLI